MKPIAIVSRIAVICIAAILTAVSSHAAEKSGGAPQTVSTESIDAASKYYVDSLVAGFVKGRELIGAPAPDAAQLAAIRKISVKWLKGKLLPYLKSTPGWLEDWIAAQNSTEIRGFNDKIMTVKTIYEFQQLMAQADQVTRTRFPKLYAAISAWAEDDFRSVNGQIEYLLTECVKQRKKNGRYVGEDIDAPIELDIE